jgi:TPR repeat protein
MGKTVEERVGEVMKRMEANDARAIYMLANSYHHGFNGSQQDHAKAMELYNRAAELGCSKAHFALGRHYDEAGGLKKAKFHYEAAAMAGHEVARCYLGMMESKSGNTERAIKHWTIAASTGECQAMHTLIKEFEGGFVSRDAIDACLIAYNNACAEMRSEARDAYMRLYIDRIDKN